MTSSHRGIGRLLLLAPLAPWAVLDAQQTRPERTAGAETSTYADVTGFLDSLARTGAPLRMGTVGFSPEGRRIPWILAARPMVDGPADAQRSGKPIIYVQGNIHAGEVEGKEAALILARRLAGGDLRRLLERVTVLVAPIYNADGNERVSVNNRPAQFGPVGGVGTRETARGLDLNRDFIKLEAIESQGLASLLSGCVGGGLGGRRRRAGIGLVGERRDSDEEQGSGRDGAHREIWLQGFLPGVGHGRREAPGTRAAVREQSSGTPFRQCDPQVTGT